MNNNNIMYSVIYTTIEVEDQQYESYGIECKNKQKVLKTVLDVSVNKDDVERLVDTLNKDKLDPIQLEDVIEDNIG